MEALSELTLQSASEVETEALGVTLADALRPGDMVALSGPLGVGKSHLSRAIIRHLLNDPMAEVPSPSYTLVNTYQIGAVEIWHADLYRLGDVSELDEIGLEDAVGHALVLVEWPDRWADLPVRRLDLEMAFASGDTRRIRVNARGQNWQNVVDALEATS